MSIANIARQIGRNSGSSGKGSQDDVMDIIEFIESPYGLRFSKEIVGQSLFPVQKFILKMFYNLPLERKEKVVTVPKSWRYAQSKGSGMYEFTEQEYLEYLFNEGRCNIREQDHERRELILPIGRRSGKCKNIFTSFVVSEKGLLSLAELNPSTDPKEDTWYDLDLTVSQEGKQKTRQADGFYYKGLDKTFKVKSHCAYNIECTGEHRVKVLCEDGKIRWKYGKDLKVGDYLCIHRNTDLWPSQYVDVSSYDNTNGHKIFEAPSVFTEEYGLLMGLLVGDGSWTDKGSIGMTIGPYPEMQTICQDIFDRLLGNWNWTFRKDKDGNIPKIGTGYLRYHSTGFREFFHHLGWNWDAKTDDKEIPWVVRRSPKSVVAAFLRGLFETDGCASQGKVSFSSASEKMAHQVQLMLLNFGIVSRVRTKRIKGNDYYELSLFGIRSARIFADEIGFLTARKQEQLQERLESLGGCKNKSRLDSVPHQKDWVLELVNSVPSNSPLNGSRGTGWNRMHVRKAAGNVVKPSSKENLTYDRLQNMLEIAKDLGVSEEILEHGQELLDLDYFFDPIVSIEESEAIVGDFHVPDTHAYVSNGMTNHNSSISAMIAAYEMYKLLKKYNPQAYYGTPEGAPIQICSIATSKDQAQILYKEVRRHFNNCMFFNPFINAETQTQATFSTPQDLETKANPSVRITFYSSVAKGIRGSANLVAIMDEVAFFNHTGQASADEVYQALSPSLAQFSPKDPNDASIPIGDSEGRMIMISSPYTKQGLFYDQYEMALSSGPGSKGLLMIQAPTWEVNPTIPRDYFEKEYEKNPVVFATEFGAEFTDSVKAWIEREDDLIACINKDLRPAKRGRTKESHFVGFDLAPKGDRTALVLTKINEENKIQLAYHEQWQAMTPWAELNPHLREPLVPYARHLNTTDILDYDEIANWLREVANRFYIEKGVFDSFEGIGFGQALEKQGLSQITMENFSQKHTSEMFQAFKTLMYQQQLELYDYVTADDHGEERTSYSPHIQELLELQGTKKGKNIIVVEAPQVKGKHDDFSDALVRSVWLATGNLLSKGKRARGAGGNAGHSRGPRSVTQYRRQRARNNNLYTGRRIK